MVEKFKLQFTQSIKAETLMFPVPAPERSIPSSTLVMIAGVLAVMIVLAWLYLKPSTEVIDEFQHLSPVVTGESDASLLEPEDKSADLPEPSLTPTEEVESKPVVVAEESKTFTQAYPIFPVPDSRPYDETRAAPIAVNDKGIFLGEGDSFIILAQEESWVEVKSDKGQVLLSKTLKAGESQELKALPNQTFSTGNAAGVSFYVDGKYYEGLGKEGEVLRGKVLHFGEVSD